MEDIYNIKLTSHHLKVIKAALDEMRAKDSRATLNTIDSQALPQYEEFEKKRRLEEKDKIQDVEKP